MTALFRQQIHVCMYVCIVGALASLDRWHRWQAATGHDVITHSRMVHGPLASLVRWQAARGHDVTTLAWLVRWHRWQLGIVGSLAARGQAWLVRWHRWSVGRLPEVMTPRTALAVGIVGPLAGCQRS